MARPSTPEMVETVDVEGLSAEPSAALVSSMTNAALPPPQYGGVNSAEPMQEWAAARRPDAKAQTLLDWINIHIRPGGQWLANE